MLQNIHLVPTSTQYYAPKLRVPSRDLQLPKTFPLMKRYLFHKRHRKPTGQRQVAKTLPKSCKLRGNFKVHTLFTYSGKLRVWSRGVNILDVPTCSAHR